MMSPFDTKNRVASILDALAVRLVLLALCIMYFFLLWSRGVESLIAGSALFLILLLGGAQFERRTLRQRDRLLRERLGGVILLDDLLLMPVAEATETVCRLLCEALGAQQKEAALLEFAGERWLVRCAQCLQHSAAGESDILAAHRARLESGAERCVLVSTGGFSPAALRAGEWVDPPIRLISGKQLAALAGRLHPATDEEIARHAKSRRTPFSFSRIRSLALSPEKQKRYLLCSFLLLLMWLAISSIWALLSCLLAFILALLCKSERSFKL